LPRIFSLGVASKTGPHDKKLESSRMSLTLIGHGTTSANPPNANLKGNAHKDNIATRTTIVKVIFISTICFRIIGPINIYRLIFEILFIGRSELKTQVMDSLVNRLSWEQ